MTELSQELIEIKPETALDVFTKPDGIKPYLDLIRVQIDAFVPIMETKDGREEIKSFAHKVTKSKTYLESVGKKLADEQKELPKKIDATRKLMKDTLDKWHDEVRSPVTVWEEAEKARIARHGENIQVISSFKDTCGTMTADQLRPVLAELEAFTVGPQCEEFEAEYMMANGFAQKAVRAALATREAYEAEQQELAELRAAKAAQEATAREDQIRREAAEAARIEEATKNAREKAAAEAAVKAAQEAAEAAAQAAQVAAERREAELKEQAAAAERKAAETIAQAQRDAELQAARDRQEQEAREANRKHCAAINRVAVKALVDSGLTEDVAKNVIILIATKRVPHVTIKY